ncbi:unnamed protein product [Absidia cylindrospora]
MLLIFSLVLPSIQKKSPVSITKWCGHLYRMNFVVLDFGFFTNDMISYYSIALTNSSHANTDHRRIAKLDRDNEVAPPPKVDISVGKALQKGRQDKGMTQKDLAQTINEKPQVVNEYEAGKATPNQQVLGKMERALGIRLRGKNIGEPLTFGKKK